MQKLQYEQVRYANGFVPATTTLSHGQRSKCADLLNSYDDSIYIHYVMILIFLQLILYKIASQDTIMHIVKQRYICKK